MFKFITRGIMPTEEEVFKKKEEKVDNRIDIEDLEKGDMMAIIIAFIQVFLPVVIGFIVFFSLLLWLLATFWLG